MQKRLEADRGQSLKGGKLLSIHLQKSSSAVESIPPPPCCLQQIPPLNIPTPPARVGKMHEGVSAGGAQEPLFEGSLLLSSSRKMNGDMEGWTSSLVALFCQPVNKCYAGDGAAGGRLWISPSPPVMIWRLSGAAPPTCDTFREESAMRWCWWRVTRLHKPCHA